MSLKCSCFVTNINSSFPKMYELKTLMPGCRSDVHLRHHGVVLFCLVKTVISYIDVLDVHSHEQLPIILLYYCYSRYIREICRCTGRRHIWKRRLNVGMTQVLPIRCRHIRIYLRERVRFFRSIEKKKKLYLYII